MVRKTEISRPAAIPLCLVIATAASLLLVSVQHGFADLAPEELAAMLNEGKAALEHGLYELAEEQFRGYLKEVPRRSAEADEAMILLASALHGTGQHEEMLRLLPRSRPGAFAFWRAMARYDLGEHEKALGTLRNFDRNCDDEEYLVRAERLRSRCYLALGQTNEALEVFASVEAKYPDSVEAPGNLLDWAKTLAADVQSDGAKRVLRTLVDRAAESEAGQEGRILLGKMLIRDGELNQAEELLFSLADEEKAQPDLRSESCLLLARVYEAQDRPAETTNILHRGIRIAPGPAMRRRAEVDLAHALLRLKRLDEGIRLLRKIVTAAPQDPTAAGLQRDLADALLESGKAPEAAAEYQHYLDTFKDPEGVAHALWGKGWALSSLEEPLYSEAAALFLLAYERFEEPVRKAESLFKVGDSRFNNGQFKPAIETYARLMDEFPESDLVLRAEFQIAESTARSKTPAGAEKLFRAIADDNAGKPIAEESLLRITEIRSDNGQYRAALAVCEELMKTYSNGVFYANALHAHGLISCRLYRYETALQDFNRVIQLAEDSRFSEQAFYMRGWCQAMLSQDDESVATYREFVKRFPKSEWAPDVMFRIGEHEYIHGNYGAAEKQFLALAQTYTNTPLAEAGLLRAGEAAMEQKEYVRATEHFGILVREYPESRKLAQARYCQGKALQALGGRYEEAILLFERVIRDHPGSDLVDMAWLRKGDCEFALGSENTNSFRSAMDCYNAVVESDTATWDTKLQARYSIATCLDKLDEEDASIKEYHRVVDTYLAARTSAYHDPGSDMWFTSAAFDLADKLVKREKYSEAIKILKRVVEADIPASREADERIEEIRLKYWMLLY